MTTAALFPCALLATLLLAPSALAQDPWATVDYAYDQDKGADAHAIAIASSGKMFVVGLETDLLTGQEQRVVRMSTDQGVTWTTSGRSSGLIPYPNGLAVNSAGHLFIASGVGGSGFPGPEFYRWVVQKSVDDGASWQLVDDWQYTPGLPSRAEHIAIDSADNIYVVGEGTPGIDEPASWIVRRSSDSGHNWQTVDAWKGYTEGNALAYQVLTTSSGIFVGGWADYPDMDPSPSYIRRSTDGGATWDTVAEFSETLKALKADATGNVYALFGRYIPDGNNSFLRRSTDGGNTWETLPYLLPHLEKNYGGMRNLEVGQGGRLIAGGSTGRGHRWVVVLSEDQGLTWRQSDDSQGVTIWRVISGLAKDSVGNLFAIGWEGVDVGGRDAWVVRRLPAVPAIPPLGITADVTNIRLTWPTNATGVTLQFATTLVGGGDWQDLVAMPVPEGDQQVVTVKREAIGSRFFRLRKP